MILQCARCGGSQVAPEFSAQAGSVLATRPELPDESLGKAVLFWRTFSAVPLASGVGIVGLFALSAVAPTVRAQPWFEWLFYLVAAPIVGHALWPTVHLVAWVVRKFRPQV